MATIDDYVVTDDLVAGLRRGARPRRGVAQGRRAAGAAFLAGSFGSGKSHFMAVLYALLGHDPAARAKAELAPVIAAHDGDLQDKKILRLAFHFLDAQSIEQCVLGGYVAPDQRAAPRRAAAGGAPERRAPSRTPRTCAPRWATMPSSPD